MAFKTSVWLPSGCGFDGVYHALPAQQQVLSFWHQPTDIAPGYVPHLTRMHSRMQGYAYFLGRMRQRGLGFELVWLGVVMAGIENASREAPVFDSALETLHSHDPSPSQGAGGVVCVAGEHAWPCGTVLRYHWCPGLSHRLCITAAQ
jgi:hypothetical protein